jgi:hypothetical protein
VAPLTLDTTNNRVGINQTTPTEALDVTGDIQASDEIRATTIKATTSMKVGLPGMEEFVLTTSDLEPLKLNATLGRVGINTVSPTRSLHVEGDTYMSGKLDVDGPVGMPGTLTVGTVNATTLAGTLSTASQPNITGVGTLDALNVTGNVNIDSSTLVVDSVNNRVGINTATPTHALHVTGAASFANNVNAATFSMGGSGTSLRAVDGSPEGVTTAPPGSLACRRDGASGTSLYTKVSGTGNTGWEAVGSASPVPVVITNTSIWNNAAATKDAFQSILSFTVDANSVYTTSFGGVGTKISSESGGQANLVIVYRSSTGLLYTEASFNSNNICCGNTTAQNGTGHGYDHTTIMNNTASAITVEVGFLSSGGATPVNTYRFNIGDLAVVYTKVK